MSRRFYMGRAWYVFGYFGLVSAVAIGVGMAYWLVGRTGSQFAALIVVPFFAVAALYAVGLRESDWWPPRAEKRGEK